MPTGLNSLDSFDGSRLAAFTQSPLKARGRPGKPIIPELDMDILSIDQIDATEFPSGPRVGNFGVIENVIVRVQEMTWADVAADPAAVPGLTQDAAGSYGIGDIPGAAAGVGTVESGDPDQIGVPYWGVTLRQLRKEIDPKYFKPSKPSDNEFGYIFDSKANFIRGEEISAYAFRDGQFTVLDDVPQPLQSVFPAKPPGRSVIGQADKFLSSSEQSSFWVYTPTPVARNDSLGVPVPGDGFWCNFISAFRKRFICDVALTGFLVHAKLRVFHFDGSIDSVTGLQRVRVRFGWKFGAPYNDTLGFYDGIAAQGFSVVRQFSIPAFTWYELPMSLADGILNYGDSGPGGGFCGHVWFAVFGETPAQWTARTGIAFG